MNTFKGLNGTIVLGSTGVSIIRDTMLGTAFHNGGETLIPYSRISEVVMVPGSLTNGYLCIVETGYGSPGSIFSALKDENTVIFRMTKNAPARKMKRLIEAKI